VSQKSEGRKKRGLIVREEPEQRGLNDDYTRESRFLQLD